jgi:hypothetical protein
MSTGRRNPGPESVSLGRSAHQISPCETSTTHISQRYTYPRLFNLYRDPKESKSYLTRKLAYLEVLRKDMRDHLTTFEAYPPKRVMGLGAPGRRRPSA